MRTTRWNIGLLTAGLFVCGGATSGALAQEKPVEALLAKTMAPTPILDDLRELSDTIGGRPTGSPALEQAIEWGVAKLRAAGFENAHTESYTAGDIWIPGAETGEVTEPRAASQPANVLRVAAMPFSSPTPSGGLEAEVLDLGAGDEAAFTAAGATARGRWLLIHSEPMHSLEDLFKEYFATPPAFAKAREQGATGILWMSTRPSKLLYRHNVTIDDSEFPLPAAVVEREGALRMARLLQAGQRVRVKLHLQPTSQHDVPCRNVVAEIPGRDKPSDVVILGAHLDSWDLGRGALDNGCNAALVIDVARQMMELARAGQKPHRTLRFVLYTGEEAGTLGSWGEVRNHRADLDHVKAQIVFDIGTGRTTGFSLGGRTDLLAAADRALEPAAAFGPLAQTTDAFIGTDNYDYLIEGVPTLVANQDGAPYLADYHAESDTFDKVDARELKNNAAIAAILMWGLADMAADPAPRQSRAEVEALAKTTGLDEQMKIFGLWDDFVSGKRGRMPAGGAH